MNQAINKGSTVQPKGFNPKQLDNCRQRLRKPGFNKKMIYPKFYHQNRWGSDRDWIHIRMNAIPEHKKKGVAIQYERLFLSGADDARKQANEYLHKTAKRYRDEKKTTTQKP